HRSRLRRWTRFPGILPAAEPGRHRAVRVLPDRGNVAREICSVNVGRAGFPRARGGSPVSQSLTRGFITIAQRAQNRLGAASATRIKPRASLRARGPSGRNLLPIFTRIRAAGRPTHLVGTSGTIDNFPRPVATSVPDTV